MTEFVNEGMTKKNNDIDGDWSRLISIKLMEINPYGLDIDFN